MNTFENSSSRHILRWPVNGNITITKSLGDSSRCYTSGQGSRSEMNRKNHSIMSRQGRIQSNTVVYHGRIMSDLYPDVLISQIRII